VTGKKIIFCLTSSKSYDLGPNLNDNKQLCIRIKKTTMLGGLFDGECPYGDLFRTPHNGNTSRQYYVLYDYFELKNRQESMALPILRIEPGTFGFSVKARFQRKIVKLCTGLSIRVARSNQSQ